MKNPDKICIVYLSTYPPRECGIATFCADLINYSDELFQGKAETKVAAMNIAGSTHKYPAKVFLQISENNKQDYIDAAEKLNAMPEVKMICIQHEYGIYGENFGENILVFLEHIQKPVTVTLHTVLPEPSEKMKEVTQKIIARVDKVIVMTELSKKLLMDVYGAPIEKIKIIPHGIHPRSYTDSLEAKNKLGLQDKFVLSTFGLLSRGKGIEYGIQAMPEIIKKYPQAVYLVIGGTHPVVLRNEGEVYRDELMALAKELKVEDHVIFYNKYLSIDELLLYLEATDVYLSLSQNPDQTVSGTLTYALGSGRPVISTAFMQAKEIVTPEVGALIGFNDSVELTKEILRLIDDEPRRLSLGKTAYFRTRNMTWSNVALSYMGLFSTLLPELNKKNKYMLPVKIDHLKKLTDDFGILQFASLSDPDPAWGYTVDDNARALVSISWYNHSEPSEENELLARTYISFIERAAESDGGFINYFDKSRQPHIELNQNENLEDACARTLWALAVASASNLPGEERNRAEELFKQQLVLHESVSSPRAAAFYIKAFAEYPEDMASYIIKYADHLVDIFKRSSDGDWKWFEEGLTYSNGILPEALLIAYEVTNNSEYLEVGKTALDFLIEHSFESDVCVPIGQAGWFKKGAKKTRYDQQPEEVSALVLALRRMFDLSNNNFYYEKMLLAFDWFLGNNLSHQVIYMHSTGGCYDGISEEGINLNQGAESTISYLLARLVIEDPR